MLKDQQELKKMAALRAVDYVRDGMAIGLGTGSTAEFAVRELGVRVGRDLSIVAVPTSDRTAGLARQLGIPLTTLEEHPTLDITIDGADEIVLSSMDAIKGLGGALLREKIVALASNTEILIVDEGKVVDRLGERTPVPVEVVAFGWSRTCAALTALGCEPTRRKAKDGSIYLTDSGNYLIDCKFPRIEDPAGLAASIKQITGVVEQGIFSRIARKVLVATQRGVEIYEKDS